MKETFADFSTLADLPGIGLCVYIGSDKSIHPPTLEEGEQVIVEEYGSLRAVARITIRDRRFGDGKNWYGIIEGEIEDISPDTSSPVVEQEVQPGHVA